MSTKTSRNTAAPAKKTEKVSSKADTLIALLKGEGGTTLEEMSQATGWQKHSVRGFMAGTLKKRGLTIRSEKTDKGRVYRIVDEAQS
jgi:predicted ArsR family transcriptional regulator